MPKLVRMYLRHVLIGFGLSLSFTGLLLWLDVAGLWHLVSHTADGPLAVVLLVVFNGIVFSGVQFGIAVMAMAERGDRAGPKGKRRSGTPRVAMATSVGHRPAPDRTRRRLGPV